MSTDQRDTQGATKDRPKYLRAETNLRDEQRARDFDDLQKHHGVCEAELLRRLIDRAAAQDLGRQRWPKGL